MTFLLVKRVLRCLSLTRAEQVRDCSGHFESKIFEHGVRACSIARRSSAQASCDDHRDKKSLVCNVHINAERKAIKYTRENHGEVSCLLFTKGQRVIRGSCRRAGNDPDCALTKSWSRKLSSGITRELRIHSFVYVNHEAFSRVCVFAAALGRINCVCCGLELRRCYRFGCQQRRGSRRSFQEPVSATYQTTHAKSMRN